MTLAWCALPEDQEADKNGNIWWYDGWTGSQSKQPYYVIDASNPGWSDACGDTGMMMRGLEVDNSISIYASPDYIHTKWNISHTHHLFDYQPADNCVGDCIANPCGKADEMEKLWRSNIEYQLYDRTAHMVLTMCQKGKGWSDLSMKNPTFDTHPQGMVAAALFEPLDYGNNIHDHIEWDKAPKGSPLGDGSGWAPLNFSQCCSTLVIAPQI